MTEKQVSAEHYAFGHYLSKRRWNSIWHQLDEVLVAEPRSVLEIGVGSGIFGLVLKHLGVGYGSVDIDEELGPDHVASVTELPFSDGAFDCVCCFQVLEHLPFSEVPQALAQIARVAKRRVIISLPDAERVWRYTLYIPFVGRKSFLLRKPGFRPETHAFDGQHHWEISKRGYGLERVLSVIEQSGIQIERTYRVFEHPYHRFFVGTPRG